MINKVTLIGRLGADPEVRHTQTGLTVANFNLATTEQFIKDGEKVKKTEWHRVVVFGKLAEICEKYLDKGKLVYIEGKLQTRSWDDNKSGIKRYTTEVIASTIQMLEWSDKGPREEQQKGEDFSKEPDFPEDDVPF